jgi:4-amino-4-deoxy-L-arabinose transferase-like glycosyltransferase
MRNRVYIILVLCIVVVGIYLRAQHLFAPWRGKHNAWGGAMYGNIARNYIKYGYWTTRFGPVSNTGSVSPEEFEYYYHYPPLLVWMASASYRLFGVHEWSARLPSLIFSIALLALLYLTARGLYDSNVALVAVALAAIMPMETYYGAHLDVYGSIAVFFSLLAFYGYVRWLDTRDGRHMAICLAGVLVGCLTAWYTYFVIPLLLGHWYWFQAFRGRPHDYRVLAIPACAVAMFVLFLVHRYLLLNSNGEILGTLTEKFWTRLSYGELGFSGVANKHLRDLVRLYSLPVLVLAAAWLAFFIRDAFRRELTERDWLLAILLGYGLLHNAVFPGLLPGHDYLGRCHTPFLALAAALAFLRIAAFTGRVANPAVRDAVAYGCMAFIVIGGVRQTQKLFAGDHPEWFIQLKRTGEIINRCTGERDVVLMAVADKVLDYYVDRKTQYGINSLEQVLRQVSKDKDTQYFYACPAVRVDALAKLLPALDARYPRVHDSDPIVYAIHPTDERHAKATR